MNDDPIVDEVRWARDQHSAEFNYDLDAIYLDLKAKERASGRKYVRYQPRVYTTLERPVIAVRAGDDKS